MASIGRLELCNLEVRDLQVVLALSLAGTTSKAASLLHLTQPAVSRALLSVEEKLGVRVFERVPRGLVATPQGETLIAGAKALLVELADLERRVKAPVIPPVRIRVVCECYTAYHWVPSAIVDLRKSLPGLDITLSVDHRADPVTALEAGDIDVALLTTAQVPAGQLEERPLFSDEIVFVMAPSHALAKKKALVPADLRSAILITSPTPIAEGQWFMTKVFGRARPRLHFERVPLTEGILDMARAGMGVGVLSEWMAGPHLTRGDLVVRRLAAGPLRRPWRIAWRREAREAALRLRTALSNSSPRLPAVAV
ncbi:Transcriptional activator MetR [Labilithrix luteola]|uniref:Transcriptional activator MetR n=1 Tax=Labilithrix luteola TaxID=1391654 RepID=A0A0K1PN65_9BACT|nr:LysR family transcriptional regulator [Labilithrix luteola]AKU94554.1 Transcriptional activator MetR [Labilithrix luteola]